MLLSFTLCRAIQLLTVFGILITSFSCQSVNNQDRPSPLTSDSIMIGDVALKITYSSPAVNGRTIWGGLEPLGKVWRIGANRATIFETTDTVLLADHKVPTGKYALFAIPDTTQWTIIVNKEWDQWGAYNYDQDKDLFRILIQPKKLDSLQERLSFQFDQSNLNFKWEYISMDLPIAVP